jgi:hypothetical protein
MSTSESKVIVVSPSGHDPVFSGSVEAAVEYLENNPSEQHRWVYIRDTTEILTEPEYLDLAT